MSADTQPHPLPNLLQQRLSLRTHLRPHRRASINICQKIEFTVQIHRCLVSELKADCLCQVVPFTDGHEDIRQGKLARGKSFRKPLWPCADRQGELGGFQFCRCAQWSDHVFSTAFQLLSACAAVTPIKATQVCTGVPLRGGLVYKPGIQDLSPTVTTNIWLALAVLFKGVYRLSWCW